MDTGVVSGKSGLPQQDIDRQRIAEVIEEASRGGKFHQHQVRKQEQLAVRIKDLRAKLEGATELERQNARSAIDRMTETLRRGMFPTGSRTFVHIDMDAFFAAVEERDHPEWRGKPLAVGGNSMLSTANYVARKYGVASAMPGYIALKLCPDLLIVPHRGDAYTEASAQSRRVFAQYDPDFSSFSLDEASLDLSDYLAEHPGVNVDDLVASLRAQVSEATGGLTCSAGIARNRFLAKLASNVHKPNGQFVIPLEDDPQQYVLDALPVRKLWGVGKVTSGLIKGVLGVESCRDVWERRHDLPMFLTPALTRNLLRSLLGLSVEEDAEAVDEGPSTRHSRSVERTFDPIDQPTAQDVQPILERLVRDLVGELRAEGVVAVGNVTLKCKLADFEVRTRSLTLKEPLTLVDDVEDERILVPTLVDVAVSLFRKMRPVDSVRLLGVRASSLTFQEDDVVVADGSDHDGVRQSSLLRFCQPIADNNDATGDVAQCPICLKTLPSAWSNLQVNEHVDGCLNHHTTTHDSKSRKRPASGPMDRFLLPK